MVGLTRPTLQLRYPGPKTPKSLGLGIHMHVSPDVPGGWRLVIVTVGYDFWLSGVAPEIDIDLVGLSP